MNLPKLLLFCLILFVSANVNSQDIKIGIDLYKEKKYDDAVKVISAIKKDSPDYAQSLYYLGKIMMDQNKLPEAQGYLEKAVDQKPQNAEYHLTLGMVYTQRVMQSNMLMQAVYAGKIKSSFEKVAELDKNNIQARWILLGYYSRAPKAMGGDMNKSKTMANEIRKIHPAEGTRAWGQIYQMENNNEEAEKSFKRAISLAPDSINNHLSLGNLYQSTQRYDLAFTLYENTLIKFPNNRYILYQIGRTASLSGENAEKGINAMKSYIELATDKNSPSLAAAYYHIGQIDQKKGNMAGAKRNYETALKLNPDHKPSKEAMEKL